jgi:hypothetical protein
MAGWRWKAKLVLAFDEELMGGEVGPDQSEEASRSARRQT